jgi:hypothetical protein
MQSENKATRAYRVQVLVIAEILKPLPDLLFTALTEFFDLYDLILDELFEPLKCDPSLGRVVGVQDLSLKLLLSQISAPDALTETLEFTVSQLSI